MVRRLPYLDGLRGFAILFVLFGHVRETHSLFPSTWGIFPDDAAGVRIFFVLSGFLITMLLRRESTDIDPGLRLKGFYLRRAFKLWPPLIFYCAAVVIVDRLTRPTCGIGALASALSFTTAFRLRGIFPAQCLELSHTWTLTIEEVFYFLWAPLIIFFRKRFALPVALIAAAMTAPLELLEWAEHAPRYQALLAPWPNVSFLLNLGYIAVGAALAEIVVSERWVRSPPSPKMARRFLMGILLTDVATRYLALHGRAPYLTVPFSNLIDSLLVASVIALSLVNPSGALARFLSFPPFRALGIISYSLYLWQQIFLRFTPPLGEYYPWQRLVPSVILPFVCAILSYFLIERPFQIKGRKYSDALGIQRKQASAETQMRKAG